MAITAGGALWWLQARQWESTDDAFIDVHMVRIAPQPAKQLQAAAALKLELQDQQVHVQAFQQLHRDEDSTIVFADFV